MSWLEIQFKYESTIHVRLFSMGSRELLRKETLTANSWLDLDSSQTTSDFIFTVRYNDPKQRSYTTNTTANMSSEEPTTTPKEETKPEADKAEEEESTAHFEPVVSVLPSYFMYSAYWLF